MKKFDAVLLDIDNTIFDFDSAEVTSFKRACEHFSIRVRDEEYNLYKSINTYYWKIYEKGEMASNLLRVKRFESFLFAVSRQDISPVAFNGIFLENLSTNTDLIDGAIDFLEYLRQKGYKVCIVTNGIKENQYNRIEKSDVHKYIDAMVVSQECEPKPSPVIFERALQKIGIWDKDKVIMCGDSLSSDILGGNNFGVDTIWFNPKGEENRTSIKPTHTVAIFDEIKKIL